MIVRDLLAFGFGLFLAWPALAVQFARGRAFGRAERYREIDDSLSHRGLSLRHLLDRRVR